MISTELLRGGASQVFHVVVVVLFYASLYINDPESGCILAIISRNDISCSTRHIDSQFNKCCVDIVEFRISHQIDWLITPKITDNLLDERIIANVVMKFFPTLAAIASWTLLQLTRFVQHQTFLGRRNLGWVISNWSQHVSPSTATPWLSCR